MISKGLGEMFEGDPADMRAGKFPRAEGLACVDPGARTPIGASGNSLNFILISLILQILLQFKYSNDTQIFAWAPN
jgi:hypothetical protein